MMEKSRQEAARSSISLDGQASGLQVSWESFPILPEWIANVSIDVLRANGAGRTEFEMGGIVVLDSGAPTDCRLFFNNGTQRFELDWGRPSPRMRDRYPGASNSGGARFLGRVKFDAVSSERSPSRTVDGVVELVLSDQCVIALIAVSSSRPLPAEQMMRTYLLEPFIESRFLFGRPKVRPVACPWVTHFASSLSADDLLWNGTTCELSGALVVSESAPPDLKLLIRQNGDTREVRWGLDSPFVKEKFGGVSNSASARFGGVIPFSLISAPFEFVLSSGRDEHVVATGSPPHLVLTDPAYRNFLRSLKSSIIACTTRDDASVYASFLASMCKIATPQRGYEWNCLLVLLNGVFRKDYAETFSLLGKIRKNFQRAGCEEMFNRFYDELLEIIRPYTFSAYNYSKSLLAREQTPIWKDIEKVILKLERLGYSAFINSGTLLGYVREGRLLPHDFDVDLAVILNSHRVEDIAAEWRALRATLADDLVVSKNRERVHLKMKIDSLPCVDLFPAWLDEKGRVFVWPHTCGEWSKDAVFPLQDAEVDGCRIPVPNQPEQLLETNYGKAWRIPDPTWRFDWAVAKKRFEVFIECLQSD